MHTARSSVSATDVARAVVKLIDSKGYKIGVALLSAVTDFEVSWDFLQNEVRPIVEELRPDNGRHKQLTHAANVHKALEEKERQADRLADY